MAYVLRQRGRLTGKPPSYNGSDKQGMLYPSSVVDTTLIFHGLRSRVVF
jgi:hypothetical protein